MDIGEASTLRGSGAGVGWDGGSVNLIIWGKSSMLQKILHTGVDVVQWYRFRALVRVWHTGIDLAYWWGFGSSEETRHVGVIWADLDSKRMGLEYRCSLVALMNPPPS